MPIADPASMPNSPKKPNLEISLLTIENQNRMFDTQAKGIQKGLPTSNFKLKKNNWCQILGGKLGIFGNSFRTG